MTRTDEFTEEQELTEEDKIFRRACVSRSFNLSGLQAVLKQTQLQVKPTELIWDIGNLNAKDYVKLDNRIARYVVNREKAEPQIEKLQSEPLFKFFGRLHDAWHDWYRSEFKEHFKVEDLAELLYHEAVYEKKILGKGKDALELLKANVKDYLWMYCRSVAETIHLPISVPMTDLRQAFMMLISYLETQNQEKCKEVVEYIPKLMQQIQLINADKMFKNILTATEYDSFLEYLKSLSPTQ